MVVLSLVLNPPRSEGGLEGFFGIFLYVWWLVFLFFFFNQMLFQRFYSHDQGPMA